MIHIGRAGTKLGSFSEFEVRQGLASGRFLRTDLAWKEGMENWAPLSRFSEFEPTPPPLPPLPDETGLGDATPSPESAGEPGLPWDYRQQMGFIAAFMQTARMVLLAPTEAFTRMLATGSLTGPLLYNLIGGWFGAIASGAYLVFTSRLQEPPVHTGIRALFYLSPENAVREMWFLVILGPLIVTLGTLIGSATAHLFLKLTGGAKQPYHVTLRVFCLSYGSSQLLQIIPVFGSMFAPIWMLVCCIVGLTAAHRTTTGRSVTAMLLLLAAFFACFIGAIALAVTGASIDPTPHP